MFKKRLVAMLGIVLMFAMGLSSVSAMEKSASGFDDDSSVDIVDDNNQVADIVEEGNFSVEEESFGEITPFASFNISHSKLGINKYVKSKSSYYIKKGEKVKVNSVTWSPSGQKIQLGFVNATTGKKYWTNNYTGGSKTGGTFSLGGPSGEYYIAIRTPSSNTKTINVNGSFDF